jgi:hypothetical protein
MLNTVAASIDLYLVVKQYSEEDGGVSTVETVIFGRDNAEREYSEVIDAVDNHDFFSIVLADASVDNHGRVTEGDWIHHWERRWGETLRDGRDTRREDTSPISYD